MTLRERILGTWELVKCVSRTRDGVESYPQGENQRGFIVYSHDGYVSVNLMVPDRPLLSAASIGSASEAEVAAITRGYMAYAGPYRVDEDKHLIHHEFDLCLNPNWIGTPQIREASFIGDHLQLSVPKTTLNNQDQSVHLEWRRPGSP